ncbi:autotransporter outer membrane beta-barrel domain-containing protein [Comamonas sediminis]|uniref:autotransporter outer membrane beta-barrel domain-containing protein n=1 Tax=Comamonas sediminis TaxID=1783360 RepID=UPI003D2C5007
MQSPKKLSRWHGGGSQGTVNISENGLWRTGQIVIGRAGQATVNIENGGSLISSHSYLGSGNGTGIVNVVGPGSSWVIPRENNSDFWIGYQKGSGTLRVANGGKVTTTSDIYTSVNHGSSSVIEIDGNNSVFSAEAWCYLGIAAPTTIKITNGGSFTCDRTTYLAWGNLSLSGAGSKWTVKTNLDIGRSQYATRGVLDIGEGSMVEVNSDLRLAADNPSAWDGSGTLNINGSVNPGVFKANRVIFGAGVQSAINFNHTDTSGNYTFSPSISNSGSGNGYVNVIGTGTTVLTGTNSYNGNTSIQAGTLRAGSAAALSSNSSYIISRSATLDLNSFNLATSALLNAGTLIIGSSNTSATVTTRQDYKGYEGAIHMAAVLGGNNSPTHNLVVGANSHGTTTLHIRNVGGTGAQTTGNGILVVQVGLASNGQFTLPAPGYIQAGAYRYTLHKVGRNWYLQSAPANAKAAAADDSAACVADPLAQGCALAPGQGAVTKALPAALKAGTANAAAAAEAEAAAPAADASAQLEAALGADDLKDDGAVGFAGAVPVPGLGMVGMVSLSSLIGVAGLRRSRKAV